MRFILLLIITLLTVTSCNKKLKEKLGVVTTGPNEYNVSRNKPLEVPPHYELPAPNETYNKSDTSEGTDKLNEGEQELINEISK